MNSNQSSNLASFEVNLKNLEDQVLIEQLQQLLAREKRIGDAILLNLREINERRLFVKMGFSILFECLVKYFHLSESAAYQRINALKLIQDVPKAQEALLSGQTNLSIMASTQSFVRKLEIEHEFPLTKQEKEVIFNSVKGKTKKEAEANFAEINPVAALPETKTKNLTDKHTLLQVTVEQATLDLINEIKNLLSHEIPDGHLNKVLKRMAEISAEQLKKKKGRDVYDETVTSNTKSTERAESVKNGMSLVIEKPFLRDNNRHDENHRSSKRCAIKSRHIPIEIRRKVFQRAHGCCEYVSSEGQRCQSHYQLEVDHVVSWSHGGEHSLENCRVLCRNHNQYRVKETHGYWYSQ